MGPGPPAAWWSMLPCLWIESLWRTHLPQEVFRTNTPGPMGTGSPGGLRVASWSPKWGSGSCAHWGSMTSLISSHGPGQEDRSLADCGLSHGA